MIFSEIAAVYSTSGTLGFNFVLILVTLNAILSILLLLPLFVFSNRVGITITKLNKYPGV